MSTPEQLARPVTRADMRVRVRTPGPAAWVALAVAAFAGVTVWWVTSDSRVPTWDAAAHMFRSMQYADAFRHGDLTEWFSSYQPPGYPPLVYLLGAFVSLVVGEGVAQFVITQNIVFVPLLALGVYRTGALAYGRRAGALAAVFALGTPIVVTQAHVFMLDLPETAMVAVALWLVLACRRFERPWVAFAAGLVCGLGMLTKNTFVLFLVGPVLVALARGGWRAPRGVAAFAAGGLITGVPWYAAHFEGLASYASGGAVSGLSPYGDPARFSPGDWMWYVWNAVNVQLYLPLVLFALAGAVWAAVRLVRRRPWAADDVTPELLGGLVLAWVLVTALSHNDSRYTLPALVYGAVLGTAWFATSPRRALRLGAGAVLVAVCVLNVVTASTGSGPALAFGAANDGGISKHRVTIFSTDGWLVAGPERSGDLQGVFAAARADGARLVAIDRVSADLNEYNAAGLTVLARFAGLQVAPGDDYAALGPRDIFVTRGDSAAEPCATMYTGQKVYLERGPDLQELGSADNLYCPTRAPARYAAPGPARVDAASRAHLARELRAARAQGARTAYFQESAVTSGLLGGAADLRRLARRAGLEPPPGGLNANVGAAGVTVFAALKGPTTPPPCFRLPDGSGLFLVRGQLTQSLDYATNLYCPTRSESTYSAPLAG